MANGAPQPTDDQLQASPQTMNLPMSGQPQSAPLTSAPAMPAAGQDQQAQPQAQQPAAQAAPPSDPNKSRFLFHHLPQAFLGAALGALAGKPETQYTVDDKGNMTPVPQAPMTTGDKLKAIAANALRGLAAGAQVPPQKSAGAAAAAGIGAGGEAVMQRQEQRDLLQRKQAAEQFERKQQAVLQQQQMAHNWVELAKVRQDLVNADLESNQKVATIGSDIVNAAVASGNGIIGDRDMSGEDLMKFRQSHDPKELYGYMPMITNAVPAVNEDGTPKIDPVTGAPQVERRYTLVNMTAPVKMTQEMKDHLVSLQVPGAESLSVNKEMPLKTFVATVWNGLKAYNAAATNGNNVDLKESEDPVTHQRTWVLFNKVTGTSIRTGVPVGDKQLEIKSGIPLGSKDGVPKEYLWDPNNSEVVRWLPIEATPATTILQNRPQGDFSQTGDSYVASLPAWQKDTVQAALKYNLNPSDIGRNREWLIGALEHATGGDWSEANYKARYDTIQSFTHGEDSKVITAANAVMHHLGLLKNAYDALQQGQPGVPALNAIANIYHINVGQPEPVVFQQIANAVGDEIARAYKGGVPDVEEQKRFEKTITGLNSPDQSEGVMGATIDLLQGKLGAERNKFLNGFQQQETPEQRGINLLSPEAVSVMAKFGRGPGAEGVQIPPNAPPNWQKTLSEGHVTVYKNGQSWTLKNGVPEQITTPAPQGK